MRGSWGVPGRGGVSIYKFVYIYIYIYIFHTAHKGLPVSVVLLLNALVGPVWRPYICPSGSPCSPFGWFKGTQQRPFLARLKSMRRKQPKDSIPAPRQPWCPCIWAVEKWQPWSKVKRPTFNTESEPIRKGSHRKVVLNAWQLTVTIRPQLMALNHGPPYGAHQNFRQPQKGTL